VRRDIYPRTSTALSSDSQARRRCSHIRNEKTAADCRGGLAGIHHEEANVLGRPGSDLLFQVLRLSTIGAGKFNGRVRDGIGYGLPANTTRPAKDVAGIRDQTSVIRRQIDLTPGKLVSTNPLAPSITTHD
jgi:hypothetical protein